MPLETHPSTFREVQRFDQWWLAPLVLGIAALGWWSFVQQILLGRPFGSDPAPDWGVWLIWLLAGVGLPWAWRRGRLVIELADGHVSARIAPLPGQRIPLHAITNIEPRRYHPIREFGGWGIRWASGGRRAWSASGDRGVELTLADGGRVLLGSADPQALAAAIEAARAEASGG
jgi:hypothetical protein